MTLRQRRSRRRWTPAPSTCRDEPTRRSKGGQRRSDVTSESPVTFWLQACRVRPCGYLALRTDIRPATSRHVTGVVSKPLVTFLTHFENLREISWTFQQNPPKTTKTSRFSPLHHKMAALDQLCSVQAVQFITHTVNQFRQTNKQTQFLGRSYNWQCINTCWFTILTILIECHYQYSHNSTNKYAVLEPESMIKRGLNTYLCTI